MSNASGREVAIFTRALELPEDRRSAYLDEVCDGDEALRFRVEALIRAHFAAADFMEAMPADSVRGEAVGLGEKVGDRIGRYKLLQQIGEGGCGVVFMAEQETPVRRTVALKVVKPGMDTKSVIARFEAERQALALMDHPNIATVLDAGATETGRPYFVMELVRGLKITDYCDRNSLSTPERLELFIQVCQAVQHAHQKGIIHRDLKPSNILVTVDESGKPLPKVIDFGIAKATTGQRLTDKTVFTAFEMLIGTPAYMSPEQAALTSVDVDTRSDIYSLGVLLYELLTGTTPFDTKELLKAGLDEVRRVILHQEPVRPSTRLSTMLAADLTTVAQRRQIEAPRLIRSVRGDLDWIVIKALEKDRGRRYQTATGLAEDVRRYLANEVISARSPSVGYRFRKLVERNKVITAAAASVVGVLAVSLVMVTQSLTQERMARGEAEQERRVAEDEAAKSRETTRFLEQMLKGIGPSVAQKRDTTLLREILEKATVRIGVDLTNRPMVQVELWTTVGDVWVELGVPGRAIEIYQRALETLRRAKGNDSPQVATLLLTLSAAFDDAAMSEPLDREALAIRRRHFGEDSEEVALALNSLAFHLSQQNKFEESESIHRELLAARRRKHGDDHLYVAQTLANLSTAVRRRGDPAEAEKLQAEAVQIWRKKVGPDSTMLAQGLGNLGLAQMAAGRHSEAEKSFRDAIQILMKSLGPWHRDVAITEINLVTVLSIMGREREAIPILEPLWKIDFVKNPEGLDLLGLRAGALASRGLWIAAKADAVRFLELRPASHAAYHLLAPLHVVLGETNEYRALCRTISDRFGHSTDVFEADRMAKDCLILPMPGFDLTIIDKLADVPVTRGAGNPAMPLFRVCKAMAAYRQGRFAEAITWAKEAQKSDFIYAKLEAGAILAMTHFRLGEHDMAERILAEALAAATSLPAVASRNIGGDWRDWIISHQLLDEAKAMIVTGSKNGIDTGKP